MRFASHRDEASPAGFVDVPPDFRDVKIAREDQRIFLAHIMQRMFLQHFGNVAVVILVLGLGGSVVSTAEAEDWVDHRVFGPFICYADFPLQDYDTLFNELAQTQRDLLERLRLPPIEERIAVFLFKDQASYRKYLAQQFPNLPYRRALFYKGTGPGIVLAYRSNELEIDVRHECTHAMLHASLPMVPLWLDEGLAEYFETPLSERAAGNPHHSAIKWNMRFGMVPELKRLEVKNTLADMGRSEYRYAWAWVHFLLHGPEPARQVLIRYIADVRRHAPPGKMSERLAAVYADPEGAMVEHFKRFK